VKFIGIKSAPLNPTIAVVRGDRAIPLAAADKFYFDLPRWLELAQSASEPGLALDKIVAAPPVWAGARVLCVGLNYHAHAAEGGFDPPSHPVIFGRWSRSLITDGDEVPALDPKLDWECELAAVVGTSMAGVSAEEALAGIMGYAPFNDISARTYQRHTHQWTPGKNADRSGVIGSIITSDEIGDPNAGLRIETCLNGKTMQSSTTDLMIFSVGEIASYLSEIMTLEPGDIIVTGTPEGVGHARKPPVFMKPGDVIEVEIEKIGKIASPIVPSPRPIASSSGKESYGNV